MGMVLPRRLARVNRVVTNRLTAPFARWLPGFGVLVHHGRRSGRQYRTPVNVFRTRDGYVIALTYGLTDWARNLVAAGGGELLTRGRRVRLTEPQVVFDPSRADLPPIPRRLVGLLGVTQLVQARAETD
jgi:deazaflavin-dependent oxidoreductase (nitroreductase family)